MTADFMQQAGDQKQPALESVHAVECKSWSKSVTARLTHAQMVFKPVVEDRIVDVVRDHA